MALFYVAHRLFAAHDRAVGAYVASRLASAAGLENVFLPFCDTDEENLVADCKGLRLFELDRARLLRLSGMIAVLHGPSLDDGVCMEIGFAVASGVPVVLFSTDDRQPCSRRRAGPGDTTRRGVGNRCLRCCGSAGVGRSPPGSWLTLANGREPNWRNLMIQYAVRGRFTSVSQFTAALEGLP